MKSTPTKSRAGRSSTRLLACWLCGNKGEVPNPPAAGDVAFVKCGKCGGVVLISGDDYPAKTETI